MTKSSGFKSRWAFWLTSVGCSVGFGNIWRFPHEVYSYGGAAFLIPYCVAGLLVGYPVLTIELALGQMVQQGAAGVFSSMGNRRVRFAGLQSFAPAFVLLFYPVLVCWTMVYFVASFKRDLPWITSKTKDSICAVLSETECLTNKLCSWSAGACSPSMLSTSMAFFAEAANVNSDFQASVSKFSLPLFYSLCVLWLLTCASGGLGPQVMGTIMYVTMTLPTAVLLGLTIVGVTLRGAGTGITAYIGQVEWHKLADLDLWTGATEQVIFSCSLGVGAMYAIGALNPRKQNFVQDALIITLADTAYALVAGLVVFSVIGFLSSTTGIPISELPLEGSGLAFISYPLGLAQLSYPWSNILCVLFFFTLALLGWDSIITYLESVAQSFYDSQWNQTRLRLQFRTVVILVSLVLFLFNLLLLTDMGMHMLDCLDAHVSSFVLLGSAFLETVIFSWILNANKSMEVVGKRAYVTHFVAFNGPPWLAGLIIGVYANGKITGAAGVVAGVSFLVAYLSVPATLFLARDGSQMPGRYPLALRGRAYQLYLANVDFFCTQANSIACERSRWRLTWGFIIAVKYILPPLLGFQFFSTVGNVDKWVPPLRSSSYPVWILAISLAGIVVFYGASLLFFLFPDLAMGLSPDENTADMLTLDNGFGVLGSETRSFSHNKSGSDPTSASVAV